MTTTTFVDVVTLVPAAWLNDVDNAAYAALTGVAGTNTITATGAANLTYAAGIIVRFIPAATNTGATTINITPSGASALGAKNMFYDGVACRGGEIKINVPAMAIYDGTQFHVLTAYPSGGYTPTLTNTTNVAASTAYLMQYMRVGAVVTVSGRIDIDPTAGGAISLGVTLPIASNFANSYECAGTAVSTASTECFAITGDATNNRANIDGLAVDTANHQIAVHFTYLLV